jgi:plastocyanin
MRRLLAVAMVGLLVLALAGCGDDDEETTTESGGSTETTMDPDMDMPGMTRNADDHGDDHSAEAKCEPSGTSLSIVASGTKFDKDCLAAPANQAVTVSMENKDTIGHNLAVVKSHTSTDVVARADVFTGPKTVTLNVPGQPAGTYAFHCEVHPRVMMGTFVVK